MKANIIANWLEAVNAVRGNNHWSLLTRKLENFLLGGFTYN